MVTLVAILTKMGKCVRRPVVLSELILKNWKDVLPVDENKSKLFSFL